MTKFFEEGGGKQAFNDYANIVIKELGVYHGLLAETLYAAEPSQCGRMLSSIVWHMPSLRS